MTLLVGSFHKLSLTLLTKWAYLVSVVGQEGYGPVLGICVNRTGKGLPIYIYFLFI